MEKRKLLISIIVPIYNMEQHLKKCISSIIAQTYQNIEIILINDGSTDKSKKICEDFANKDDRIKIINQKNKGVSGARNAGIDIAKGEYLGFIDPDDYISEDMYEILYNLITKYVADISMCSHYRVEKNMNSCLYITEELEFYNKDEALKALLIDKKIQNYSWDKLYKKDLFKNIRFPLGKNYEDIGTLFYIFEKITKLVYINSPKYFYLRRESSITETRSETNLTDYINMSYVRNKYIEKHYPELEIYNSYNIVIAIINTFRYGYKLTDFLDSKMMQEMYTVFEKILTSSLKENVFDIMCDWQKVDVYILLWDKVLYNDISYLLYEMYKKVHMKSLELLLNKDKRQLVFDVQ